MKPEEREALRSRFDFRCGYCGVREADAGAELTVDHFQPRSRSGADDPTNWVYCCFTCNTHKSDVWAPGSAHRILHPLDDDLSSHMAECAEGTLAGLTETGKFHIQQLQLNRPALVAHRLARKRQEVLTQRLDALLQQQDELRRQVEGLEQAVAEAERRLASS
jgi:hypothetical protein